MWALHPDAKTRRLNSPMATSAIEASTARGETGAAEDLDAGLTSRLQHWEKLFASAVLVLGIVAGVLARGCLSLHDAGTYWPDEIFNGIEVGHRLAFGYGLLPWEYMVGARTWVFPGLLAGLLRALAAAGLVDPAQYVPAVKLVFTMLAGTTAAAVYVLARRLGADRLSAAVGAVGFALFVPAIYFAPRTLSETASALPVIAGFALALPAGASSRQRLIGAALLGSTLALRLPNGMFCASLIGVFALRREWRAAIEATAMIAAAFLVSGGIDWVTWGSPFHSSIAYMTFTLKGGASRWGVSPGGYYLVSLFTSGGYAFVALAGLAIAAMCRRPYLAVLILPYLLVHSLIAHKELRFVYPWLPLLAVGAAMGLNLLRRRRPPAIHFAACLLVIALVGAGTSRFHDLTYGQLGAYSGLKASLTAYDDPGPTNRLLTVAGRQGDICGIKVETANTLDTGGYTYLHRRVPLFDGKATQANGQFNYLVTGTPAPAGTALVARDHRVRLSRLPGGCPLSTRGAGAAAGF